MRVLHILEATSGGTRRHVLDLLPALQKRGVHCTLIYSPLRNPAFRKDAERLQASGIETTEVAMGHRWSRRTDADALRAIRSHLKSNSYDLIHCHSSNAGVLGRLANATTRPRLPLVYTPHYIAFAAGLPRVQRRAALYLEKLLTGQSSHYIAVSHHERALLQRVLKIEASRTGVIYNGIEISDCASADIQPATQNDFVIGCFGRLTAQKNQSTLLRALPAILSEVPTARVKFVGGGEDEDRLQELVQRLNCNDRVDFRGEVHDVAKEYSECDVVAHPSRWEGCSYSLLEAMNCLRAIVASNAGGNPEVIGEAGVLLPACDALSLVQEIIALAGNPERRQSFGDAAHKRVAEYFRLDDMVTQTLAVYQQVLR
jgi:glycosyltransferase involved in cell wall biosynthesis